MSIVKEYFYNMQCDCCGGLDDDEYWTVDEVHARENAESGDWINRGGRDYCSNCWRYNEDDDIETKDGKVWDGKTDELKYDRLNTPKSEGLI